jgi:dienelactone hydrolase
MANLYYSPVFLGIQDSVIEADTGSFEVRVFYPSERPFTGEVIVRSGTYPLVIFAHGDRTTRAQQSQLCPADVTEDYKRWNRVLRLLARCGLVVAAPAVHDVLNDSEITAARLEETVKWMRTQWIGKETLYGPDVFDDDRDLLSEQTKHAECTGSQATRFGPNDPPGHHPGLPTALGLVGHSWGARACARVAVRGQVQVRALASIAGTWDANDAISALIDSNAPTLLVCGTQDIDTFSYLPGLWPSLVSPKHQAALQGLDHWDWFGPNGAIKPCDANADTPACPIGWHVASELLLGFMTKYLVRDTSLPPYLIGSAGERPALLDHFDSTNCALKVRWDDPLASEPEPTTGEKTFGQWTGAGPSW